MKGLNEANQYQTVSYFADAQKVPDVMTEEELIHFLRIPQISKSDNYSNVVKNLVRMRDLPQIQICNRSLYPTKAILEWIDKETIQDYS